MGGDAPRPFHVRDNFAPVDREVTAVDLPVEGAIPRALRGLYLRNGPNPRQPSNHWFAGDGMVHGVRLEDGRCAWYRNRWVQTRALTEGASLVTPEGTVDHTVGVANTNVIGHAGRIFALVESSFPTELDRELATRGVCDFDGRLTDQHDRAPEALPADRRAALLRLRVPSAVAHVPPPRCGGPARAQRGDHRPRADDDPRLRAHRPPRGVHGPADRLQLRARDGRQLPVRVERHLRRASRRHAARRRQRRRALVRDRALLRLPSHERPRHGRRGRRSTSSATASSGAAAPSTSPRRGSIAGRSTCDVGAREGAPAGRPPDRVPAHRRAPHRRDATASATPSPTRATSAGSATAIVKYDLRRGTAVSHEFGAGRHPGEAVFVPNEGATAEDDGVLLCFVYDAARDGSDFVVLDARAPADRRSRPCACHSACRSGSTATGSRRSADVSACAPA